MTTESIVYSNYFHYRYTLVNLDTIVFSLIIRKVFLLCGIVSKSFFQISNSIYYLEIL